MLQQHSRVSSVLPCTPTSQALFLPEVLFRVGCYLDGWQALICSQVCSTWYINFAPLVWENLRIGRPKANAKANEYQYQRMLEPRIRSIDLVSKNCNSSEQLDIIRNKASWLRSLTIHKHVSPQQFKLGKECTQLQAIEIAGSWPINDDYNREYWNSCKVLIKQNRSRLTSLTLRRMHFAWNIPTPAMLRWDLVLGCAGCANLTKLVLEYYYIRGRNLKPFWEICERLESLTLVYVSFDYSRLPTLEQIEYNSKAARVAREKAAMSASEDPNPPPPSPKRFPNLRELTVRELPNGGPERFLDLIIADCPRLESLDWTLKHMTIYLEFFSDHIIAGTWPLLDKIRLNVYYFEASDDMLGTILQHTRKPLKLFSYGDGYFPNFRGRTYDLVKERHFSTLQEMNLTFIVDKCLIQDILASCPSLEVVSATGLDAVTVMKDKRPWACLGLKEFTMALVITLESPYDSHIATWEQQQEESRALYTQLARLKQLRSLSLDSSVVRGRCGFTGPLPLRLEMGLDLLAGHTQLEVIKLRDDQNMERNDILWMVEHLTSLKMIHSGRLNGKRTEVKVFKDKYLWDFELAKILNGHGIETPSSIYEEGYLDDVRHLLGKRWPEDDDFLHVNEEPAALKEVVQAVAPTETVQAVVLEDAVQAVKPEETIQAVIPEVTVRHWSWTRQFKQWNLWRRFKRRHFRRQSIQS